MIVSSSELEISFPAPMDFVRWADGMTLVHYLKRGGKSVSQSLQSIINPRMRQSVFNDTELEWNTIRMLAACHDNREYLNEKPVRSDYQENEAILGLRHFSYDGASLTFDLISSNEAAHKYAMALVAVTNLTWNITGTMLDSKEADVFRIEDEEVWLKSQPLVSLVQRNTHRIDHLLEAMDQRCTINVDEIERIMESGALGNGVL